MIDHLAIIPDGNRRYSKKYKITLEESYQQGIEQVFKISKEFFEFGVSEISIFGFSTKNWKREESQINIIQKLFLRNGKNFFKKRKEFKDIKINFIGDLTKFEDSLVKTLINIQQNTPKNKRNTLNILLNYSSKEELYNCVKKYKEGNNIWNYLQIKNKVDLLIRTGGYQRISDFLPIQSSNAEFYFEKKLWSELTEKDVKKIINWFNNQQRNFGI